MTEPTVEAFSKRDPQSGADLLGTCTVVVGDGTMKIDFVNGRAQVPKSLLELALKHPHIVIPGHGSSGDDGALSELEAAKKRVAELEELAATRARIAELEAAEVEAARNAPKPQESPTIEFADSEQPPTPEEPPADENPALELAKEYLESEGLEVPEPEPTEADASGQTPAPPANPGFEATTGDDQPRCQAAKADGTQCANAAVNGQACQLSKHQEQLAAASA